MNKTKVSTSKTTSWLAFSLLLGCHLGLFGLALIRQPVTMGFWVLMPALLAGLLLPLSGALGDALKTLGKPALIFGLALVFWLDLHFFFDLPSGLLAAGFIPLFLFALHFQTAAACHFSHRTRIALPGLGSFTTLGAFALMLAVGSWWGDSQGFSTLLLLATSLLTALCALVFYLGIQEEGILQLGDLKTQTDTELRGFSRAVSSFSDALFLFLFLLALALATTLSQYLIYRKLVVVSGPESSGPSLILFITAATAGCFFSQKIAAMIGLKRLLALSTFVLTLIHGSAYLLEGFNSLFLLGTIGVAVMGVSFGATCGLIVTLLPRSKAGQGTGYFLAILVCGFIIGRFLVISGTSWWLFWLAGILFLTALFVLQNISPARAVRLSLDPEESPPKGVKDLEWDWYPEESKGQGRHTLISRSIQSLARVLAELFFGRIRVKGRNNLQVSDGAIFVANHPNTFLDPLLITALVPGRMHYWAKSTLWKRPILGSILDALGAIPVYRKKDGEARPGSNQQTLGNASEKLNQAAQILIFPEGVSEMGLSLKPIKTGAARLGFQAMEACGWTTDLPIIPVGIDYAEPTLFRSNVTLRVGKPIRLKKYADAFSKDPRNAVVEVTAAITERLRNLLPHLDEPALETLVKHIQDLYGDQVLQILKEKDETAARRTIAEAVNHYQRMDPDTVLLFSQRINTFYQEKKRLSTPDNHPPIPTGEFLKILLSLFSLASFGLVTNWIPYRLTGRMVQAMMPSPSTWRGTAKLGLGIAVFLIYYLLIGGITSYFVGPVIGIAVVAVIAISALFALGAMNRFAFRFQQLKTLWQAFWTQDTNDDLEAMRVSLMQDLERFRESFAFYKSKEMEQW